MHKNKRIYIAYVFIIAITITLLTFSINGNAEADSLSEWATGDFNKAVQLGLLPEESNISFTKVITRAEFIELSQRLYNIMGNDGLLIRNQLDQEFGSFDKMITREEASYILKYFLDNFNKKLSETDESEIIYSDMKNINSKYMDSINYLTANKILVGYSGKFHPEKGLTYEQAVVILYRAYEYLAEDVKLFINSSYQGFYLNEKKSLIEKNATLYVFEHEKTGAELVFIKNNDKNKVFSIAIKTPPENDKGISHILEHSILNGSKKYPIKDLVIGQLMNGPSLYTYMNARTADLFTHYPIASANTTDYNNLMSVYIDAVYNPLLTENKNIFLKEGIRKDFNPETNTLEYNGVVYNEMKSSEATLYYNRMKTLYPDTAYAYRAGGKQAEIEMLTYEEMIDFYNKYYHPSNSLVYIYGDVDIIDRLQFINENYFSRYDRKNYNELNIKQPAFEKGVSVQFPYNVDQDTDLENKYIHTLAYAVNDYKDYDERISFSLLKMILNSSNSILEENLEKAGLSTFYNVSYSKNIKQNVLYFSIYDSKADDMKLFAEVVKETMDFISKNGIDIEIVNDIIGAENLIDSITALSVDNGIAYNDTVIRNWIYGAPYTQYINSNLEYSEVKKQFNTNYYKNLIDKYIFNNNHYAYITHAPSTTMLMDRSEASAKRLEEYEQSLSKAQIDNHINELEEFYLFLNTPNTEEELSKLPTIPIQDLYGDIKDFEYNEKNIEDVKILRVDDNVGDLLHLNYLFENSQIAQDDLQYLTLVLNLLGNLETENYSLNQLNNKLMNMVRLSFNTSALRNPDNLNEYVTKNIVKLDTLVENIDEVNDLVLEIIYNTNFQNKERIKQYVTRMIAGYESSDPIDLLGMQLFGYVSSGDAYKTHVRGLPYYNFLKKINSLLDSDPEQVINKLELVYSRSFPKDNLIINILGKKNNNNMIEDKIIDFSNQLKSVDLTTNNYNFKTAVNEAYKANISVQYNGLIVDYKELGYEFSGKLAVLKEILSQYLHYHLRTINGAYNGFLGFDRNNMFAYSYRDPKLAETYEIYKTMPDFIEQIQLSETELNNFIISAYGKANTLKSIIEQNDKYLVFELNNTRIRREEIINELLSTTIDDIRGYAPMLRDLVDNAYYGSVGNSDVIENNQELFDHVKNYLE